MKVGSTYKYVRFMRDGSVQERTGVVRQRKRSKNDKKKNSKQEGN